MDFSTRKHTLYIILPVLDVDLSKSTIHLTGWGVYGEHIWTPLAYYNMLSAVFLGSLLSMLQWNIIWGDINLMFPIYSLMTSTWFHTFSWVSGALVASVSCWNFRSRGGMGKMGWKKWAQIGTIESLHTQSPGCFPHPWIISLSFPFANLFSLKLSVLSSKAKRVRLTRAP